LLIISTWTTWQSAGPGWMYRVQTLEDEIALALHGTWTTIAVRLPSCFG
jgi:hypothetical protein